MIDDSPTLSSLANDIRISVRRHMPIALADAVAVVYVKALLPHATKQPNGQWRVRLQGLDICADVRISRRVAYADVISIKTLKAQPLKSKAPTAPKKPARKRSLSPKR